ncbi:hypothetical protein [Pedobacter metabolipauper]|uniref:Uncharacterized protein n=1 Tax=Pedobacter metabolipauper TaxID=425513 RepID=A0A4R6SRG4_9SPHI|nr:hypothetical protein [Pedobacter metabolipauper]TDQ06947.1 hypothetical protein ATK78_3962 [Pedobacter metabolipauper]
MENRNEDSGKAHLENAGQAKDIDHTNNGVQFENSDVDPGFDGHQHDDGLTGIEDEREHDIDAGTSIKELRGEGTDDTLSEQKGTDDEAGENDALNYKNDRENGAYNPKNI